MLGSVPSPKRETFLFTPVVQIAQTLRTMLAHATIEGTRSFITISRSRDFTDWSVNRYPRKSPTVMQRTETFDCMLPLTSFNLATLRCQVKRGIHIHPRPRSTIVHGAITGSVYSRFAWGVLTLPSRASSSFSPVLITKPISLIRESAS